MVEGALERPACCMPLHSFDAYVEPVWRIGECSRRSPRKSEQINLQRLSSVGILRLKLGQPGTA
jgi:hypothetical protein